MKVSLGALLALSVRSHIYTTTGFTLYQYGEKKNSFFRHSEKNSFPVISRLSSTAEATNDVAPLNGDDENGGLPELGKDGIYKIANKEEYLSFLNANIDKIIVIKFFAPWCRACKGLEPKFIQVSKDERYKNLPLIFAEFSVQHNRDYVKALGVLALPNVLIYAGPDGLVDNFPCGPSKLPILKKKIANVVNERVDPKSLKLKACEDSPACDVAESEPCMEREVSTTDGDVRVKQEDLDYVRKNVLYFTDFTNEEFSTLMGKAKLLSFDAGSVIMRQGQPGSKFYVIESGEVEICIKSQFDDPMQSPNSYLGAVINRFSKNDYFGERALITGEPRAASIRASEKTRCLTFDVEDIPSSSVLSGKKNASSERIAEINDKYGVDVFNVDEAAAVKQAKEANSWNQSRGSVNTPGKIEGVDTDSDINDGDTIEDLNSQKPKENVIALLMRLKTLRSVARCFEYIADTQPRWGDVGEINRRAMLVKMLSPSQKSEYKAAFEIIDKSHDNIVSVTEMKNFMNSIGVEKKEEELLDMIDKSNPLVQGNTEITFDEYMGVMAEAEYYFLFRETFNALDKHNVGFVKAEDLDRVLDGVRDLISDDRKSIIDIEDKDMLIDYDEFAKMLLGISL